MTFRSTRMRLGSLLTLFFLVVALAVVVAAPRRIDKLVRSQHLQGAEAVARVLASQARGTGLSESAIAASGAAYAVIMADPARGAPAHPPHGAESDGLVHLRVPAAGGSELWAGFPTAGVDALLWRNQGFALLVGALLFFVGTLGSWSILGVLVRALERLTHLADEVAHGKMSLAAFTASASLQTDRDRDEAARLGVAFRAMVAEVARTVSDLESEKERAVAATRAKSTFLANMSHELRTPLNAILGYSEMLAEDLDSEHSLRDVDHMHTAGTHLLALINDLLDIARIEAGRMTVYAERFDLAALVSEINDGLIPAAQRNRNQVTLDLDGALGLVCTDRTKVRQCIQNLLSNALKFTEDGDVSVRVFARGDDEDRCVGVEVSDTGIGMDADQLDHVFDAFRQADASTTRPFGGTGLGLSLVRRLMQLLGGQVTVRSIPGEGSVFTLTFPAEHAVPAVTPDFPDTARIPGALPDGRPTALVIDDDPAVRDLLCRHLEKEGYAVATAADGPEGLTRARELRPTLITLDVFLPGRDGFWVPSRLKTDPVLASTPVVVTISDEQDKGYALGAADSPHGPRPMKIARVHGRRILC